MTTAIRPYPAHVALRFQGKSGQVAIDQLRAVDRERLIRKLGTVSAQYRTANIFGSDRNVQPIVNREADQCGAAIS
jgi:hypothetical protein